MLNEKMLPFLAENRQKNSKLWYSEHKGEYKEYVYEPLSYLVMQLSSALLKFDPLICVEPRRCISRVYRDTRFSKDKTSIYRDNVWLGFKRPSKTMSEAPSFYFELMQGVWRCGMGFYCAPKQVMANYRAFISSNPTEFKKIIKPLRKMHSETEHFKRKPLEECEPGLEDWMSCKSVHVCMSSSDFSSVYTDDIVAELISYFKEAVPLYNLMLSLLCAEPEPAPVKEKLIIPENTNKFEW